jgi:hypothetical protein
MSYSGPERRAVIAFTREDSERLVRLEQQLINTDSKIQTLVNSLSEATISATQKLDALEERISKIERKQSWMIGMGTAIGFLLSLAVEAIVEFFRR